MSMYRVAMTNFASGVLHGDSVSNTNHREAHIHTLKIVLSRFTPFVAGVWNRCRREKRENDDGRTCMARARGIYCAIVRVSQRRSSSTPREYSIYIYTSQAFISAQNFLADMKKLEKKNEKFFSHKRNNKKYNEQKFFFYTIILFINRSCTHVLYIYRAALSAVESI